MRRSGRWLDPTAPLAVTLPAAQPLPPLDSASTWLDRIAADGHGVIMTMGKGGVGKTTVAAGLAVALAQRGHRVHLTTTDPAAHVAAALAGELAGLTVSRIDPVAETAAYVTQVLADQGAALDPESRALLEEDLRSPCTEEIAVFRAFARTVAAGTDRLSCSIRRRRDTPCSSSMPPKPTTASSAARRGMPCPRRSSRCSRGCVIRTSPASSWWHSPRPLPCTRPPHSKPTLQRAGIEPFGWVVNQCFALTPTRDPLLTERARRELPYLTEVVTTHAARTIALPWLAIEPVGIAALGQLFLHPLSP